jgi:HlyD family secretion protein
VITIAKGKAAGLNENPAAAEKQIGNEKSPHTVQSDPTPAPDGATASKRWIKPAMVAAALIVAIGIAVAVWYRMKPSGPGVGFVSGNGRVEATEIDVATKLSGRVLEILANEGDFVRAEQVLARMQIDVLDAQRDEARAQSLQAVTAVASAEAQVAARQSDTAAARAMVTLRMSDLDAAQRRFARTEKLANKGAVPFQSLDDDRASVHGAEAAVK